MQDLMFRKIDERSTFIGGWDEREAIKRIIRKRMSECSPFAREIYAGLLNDIKARAAMLRKERDRRNARA